MWSLYSLPSLLFSEGLWDASKKAGELHGYLRLGRGFKENLPAISRMPLTPVVWGEVLGMFGYQHFIKVNSPGFRLSQLFPRSPGLPIISTHYSANLSSAYFVPGTKLFCIHDNF